MITQADPSMAHSLLVINGPNLNLLGTREPERYGSRSLEDLERYCVETARAMGAQAHCFQSNGEGAIIDAIHAARGKHDALIINAGAYSHTSIAIRDALSAVMLPVWEVHITNIHAREDFRRHSHVSGIARGLVCGHGMAGYRHAIEAALAALGGE